ncbi:DUF6300 family protein [Lentzea alba]|uniref:DUF6300 family protein n=1 Tax=Lentzea alba TaxID=2714351 RepID=UPI0039BFDA05
MDIEVTRSEGALCHRCGRPLLALLDVPHSFRREDGVEVRGRRRVGLCANCDRHDTAGQGLIAFFTVNTGIADNQVGEVADLVAEWIARLPPPPDLSDMVEPDEENWRQNGA